MNMGLFAYRLLGAAMMDAGMYEGIEADRRTTMQALAAVVLASLAAGIGAGDWLGTRLATLPLLGMIAVIQTFVYPNAYAEHLTWASILLFLLTRGGGAWSVDRAIGLEPPDAASR
jgi:uncharacterized membrane protein YphA (DoxX/SURF4 family)